LVLAALAGSVGPAWADESYGAAIGTKAGSGFANMALSFLELPKNVVNTTNQTNLAVGLTGGVVKGIVHTAGRILSGAADLITFPFPTQPITDPVYPWENFTVETRYNPVFVPKK
jgi:putative exosortase-associated protein (TIGR04073 family)